MERFSVGLPQNMGEVLYVGRGREFAALPFNLQVRRSFFAVNMEVEPILTRVYCCNIFKMH